MPRPNPSGSNAIEKASTALAPSSFRRRAHASGPPKGSSFDNAIVHAQSQID
jgi:hypothetical protein